MYVTARSWGIQPSEFWAMTMVEWFAEAQLHQRQNEGQKPVRGHLSEAEIERLKLLIED